MLRTIGIGPVSYVWNLLGGLPVFRNRRLRLGASPAAQTPSNAANEGPFPDKAVPPQSSGAERDALPVFRNRRVRLGTNPAAQTPSNAANESPFSRKVVPPQSSGDAAVGLPVFRNRRLRLGADPTAPKPSDAAAAAPSRFGYTALFFIVGLVLGWSIALGQGSLRLPASAVLGTDQESQLGNELGMDAGIPLDPGKVEGRPGALGPVDGSTPSLYGGRIRALVVTTFTPAPTETPTVSPTPTITPTPRPPFVWPADGWVSQRMSEVHPSGLDIAVNTGEPVRAARDGRVTFVGGDPCCVYGYFVIIEHAGEWTSLYAHLSAFAVGAGDEVTQGQLVGQSGETGEARGAHLHFELRSSGALVDPLNHLPPR